MFIQRLFVVELGLLEVSSLPLVTRPVVFGCTCMIKPLVHQSPVSRSMLRYKVSKVYTHVHIQYSLLSNRCFAGGVHGERKCLVKDNDLLPESRWIRLHRANMPLCHHILLEGLLP